MVSIKKNIEIITERIKHAAKKCGKNADEIALLAVSKFQSAEKIEEAYHCGIRNFAENYMQEWQKKSQELSHLPDIRWHLIGNLQKNKVKFLSDKISILQSVDSLSLAQEIEKRWNFAKPLNILVQLQIDKNDPNKSGIAAENALVLFEYIVRHPKLNLLGFMGIGPNLNNPLHLKKLYENFIQNCEHFWKQFGKGNEKNISLGMSQDYELAIECGSNMVRIGSSLFGERSH